MNAQRLAGRTALITGAARGIGRAVAGAMAAEGAAVAVADIDGAAAETAAAALRQAGHRAIAVSLDVSDEAQVRAAFDQVEDVLGPVDVLVNNAGVYPTSPLDRLETAEWDRVLAINLRGTFLCTREVVRRLKAAGRPGAVINVASTAAVVARPNVAHYAASKAAVVQFTRVAAIETAPFGIRVNALCPGLVETEGVLGALATDVARQEHAAKVARIPMGRTGAPAELGRAAVFLASDDAAYVTGHALYVDGGYSAGQSFSEVDFDQEKEAR